ncbi:helix-turn-helix domain-containing protein [Sphingomonas sp. HMP6]|uniref:helix-turn-helix domain-containing protein n=1 Tax=Sphingomonas sp. HMP6 TaxID=1517551 RepID=UPI0015965C22|nr:helix-turn-helix domain-containing protein [Sphingomonas sp. HMP6]BCA60225.1 hypothetical protein HMP06_2994 [Sphingomonas sp. HMP6]
MDDQPTPFEALTDAVRIAGGQSALARICGKSQPAVWKWLQSSKRLPAEHVIAVEAATRISRHALRPDIYPPEHPSHPSLRGDVSSVAPGGPIVACDRPAFLQRKVA